ncbi:CIC11C00000005272 [Sungouiella intermedia]|uniref:CIC11C00000005272 n=1 Tax=Sungouiella intermedia TaxID=45354 RepID=A0A1L0D304_9ASCO|nr:CIC11C00000005272 [[Candida] intermedia]
MNSTPRKSLQGLDSLSLIEEAQKIAKSVKSWKKASPHYFSVPQSTSKVATDIYSANFNDDYWVARHNNFSELSAAGRKSIFGHLMDYSVASTDELAKCHTEYEKGYITELQDFKLSPFVLENPPKDYHCFTYLAELYYELQWPLKKRKFCNLIHIAKSKDGNRGYVISIAIDPSLIPNSSPDTQFVHAQYTSVEEVVFDPDRDTLDWIMTTSSDAKGNVPLWLAKATMNGVVAKDVLHFLHWVSHKE